MTADEHYLMGFCTVAAIFITCMYFWHDRRCIRVTASECFDHLEYGAWKSLPDITREIEDEHDGWCDKVAAMDALLELVSDDLAESRVHYGIPGDSIFGTIEYRRKSFLDPIMGSHTPVEPLGTLIA